MKYTCIHHDLLGTSVTLPPGFRQLIHDYGIFQIVRTTSLDALRA